MHDIKMEMVIIEGKDLRIQIRLQKTYPSKKVSGISKNKSLYLEILDRTKEKNMTLRNYIESLGFTYVRGWKKELVESEVIILLNGLFPQKFISNISDIAKKDPTLYNHINETCKKRGVNVSYYLTQLGFQYLNTNSNYDMKSIDILCKNYNVNKSELARIIGTTRQNLEEKLETKKTSENPYKNYEFNNEESKLIISVIQSRTHYYEDNFNKIIIKIYHSINGNGSNAILYKKQFKIKICFNLSVNILNLLDKFGFKKYQEQDMDILKKIYSEDNLIKVYEKDPKDGLTIVDIDDCKIKSKLCARAKYLNMTLKEYTAYLKIKVLDKRKYSDEYIENLLQKYKLDNNIVKIPPHSNDYSSILRIANTRGYKKLKDFIIAYGFKYERIRDVSVSNIDKKYKEIIKKRYIVEGKKIYINSLDPFYNRLQSFCYKHQTPLNIYLSDLGFERIGDSKNLPENFIEYDWKTEEANKKREIYSNERICLFLDELSNKNKEIYIDTTSQTYYNLWKIANIRNIPINKLIEMLGYKRIYAYNNHEVERPTIETVNVDFDEKNIHEMLKALEKVQGNLDKTKNKGEKIKRSQSLVKKLKRLYHNKCQLCCPDNSGFSVPPIEKENGELYVEVHHIKHISEAFNSNDESNELIDYYKNVIVVCSYHHKYLHYYHGGFKEIIQEKDGQLYFKSKLGDTLRIFTNYHLTNTK